MYRFGNLRTKMCKLSKLKTKRCVVHRFNNLWIYERLVQITDLRILKFPLTSSERSFIEMQVKEQNTNNYNKQKQNKYIF